MVEWQGMAKRVLLPRHFGRDALSPAFGGLARFFFGAVSAVATLGKRGRLYPPDRATRFGTPVGIRVGRRGIAVGMGNFILRP